jgi:hypothetical protein
MKTKTIFAFIALFLSVTVVSAQKRKKIMMNSHAAIIDALTAVKSSCESVRALSAKWPDSVKNKMGLLYTAAKASSDRLISGYEVIIPNWRYAQKNNIDVKPQLEAVQKANNDMVAYFNTSYLKYGSKAAALSITTEFIDMVFEGITKAYQFVKGISEEQKTLYKQQVEDQRISYEFNGDKDPDPAPAKTTSSKDDTSKSNKNGSDQKKPAKTKKN